MGIGPHAWRNLQVHQAGPMNSFDLHRLQVWILQWEQKHCEYSAYCDRQQQEGSVVAVIEDTTDSCLAYLIADADDVRAAAAAGCHILAAAAVALMDNQIQVGVDVAGCCSRNHQAALKAWHNKPAC